MWPSRTYEYSSSFRSVCIGAPSVLGGSGCSTRLKAPPVLSPSIMNLTPSANGFALGRAEHMTDRSFFLSSYIVFAETWRSRRRVVKFN
jgi:hypothetical protein